MKLCLITDKPDFASEAERAGVARIMLDLEKVGKLQRQRGRDLFLSDHVLESVARMKAALKTAAVVVRVNPLTQASDEEIDAVEEARADFIMLPYFHTLHEVRGFLSLVRGRSKTILLVETKSAIEVLPEILKESGVDEIHIGLNDLSISLGHKTIFEPLSSGIIDHGSALLLKKGTPFGFGGIARLTARGLPVDPERVLAEQVRLGASIGWLGRTFRGEMETRRSPGELEGEIKLIHKTVDKWAGASEKEFVQNRKALIKEVERWTATANV
jgi:citrate lyase beta subunit